MVIFCEKIYTALLESKLSNNLKILKHTKLTLDDLLILTSIIIMKSLTEEESIYSDIYGDSRNSDKILDSCVLLLSNYMIFNNLVFLETRNIRTFFLKMIDFAVNKKIIDKIKIQDYRKKGCNTPILWKSTLDVKFTNVNRIFNISFVPYKCVEYNDELYLVGEHFSKIVKLYKKNPNSHTSFKIMDMEYMKRTTSTKLYIDEESIENIRKNIYNEQEPNEIKKEINIISNRIREKFIKTNLTMNTKKELEELQREYSEKSIRYLMIVFFNKFTKEKDPLYFPIFFDFRGRKYYLSPIGPTTSRISRFIFHYGYYNISDFNETKKIPFIWEYERLMKNKCFKNNIKYDKIFTEIVFHLLIGIGKQIKNSTSYIRNTEFFIEKAFEIISGKIKYDFMEESDKTEINHYIYILKNLHPNMKKRIILKDGTASVFQVIMSILGPKNHKSLNYVNLGNENKSHDTYTFIRDDFISSYTLKQKKNIEHLINILPRKAIKVALMIIPYSAGEEKCYQRYSEELNKSNPKLILSEDDRKIFRSFYIHAKKKIEENHLYKTTTLEFQENAKKKIEKERSYIIESITGMANIIYYKTIIKTMDVSYTQPVITDGIVKEVSIRTTKSYSIVSNTIDYRETMIAFGANHTHFFDADLLREVENYIDISYITIHDAFLVELNGVSDLIIALNDIYTKKMKKFGDYEVNNIYIIL